MSIVISSFEEITAFCTSIYCINCAKQQIKKVYYMFLERTLDLIQKKGITKNKLLTDLHLSKNSFLNWSERGNIPSAEVVQKIADYLDVPLDYLLGRTDDSNQKPGETNIRFDEFEFAMHNETKDLSDDDKNMLLDMARILKNRIMEKNNSKE